MDTIDSRDAEIAQLRDEVEALRRNVKHWAGDWGKMRDERDALAEQNDTLTERARVLEANLAAANTPRWPLVRAVLAGDALPVTIAAVRDFFETNPIVLRDAQGVVIAIIRPGYDEIRHAEAAPQPAALDRKKLGQLAYAAAMRGRPEDAAALWDSISEPRQEHYCRAAEAVTSALRLAAVLSLEESADVWNIKRQHVADEGSWTAEEWGAEQTHRHRARLIEIIDRLTNPVPASTEEL